MTIAREAVAADATQTYGVLDTDEQPALSEAPADRPVPVTSELERVRAEMAACVLNGGESAARRMRLNKADREKLVALAGRQEAADKTWRVAAVLGGKPERADRVRALAGLQSSLEQFRRAGKRLDVRLEEGALVDASDAWAIMALMARFPDTMRLARESEILLHRRAGELATMQRINEQLAEPAGGNVLSSHPTVIERPAAPGDAKRWSDCGEAMATADAAYALRAVQAFRDHAFDDDAVRDAARRALIGGLNGRLQAVYREERQTSAA
jgi:hypothetical protein